MASEEEKPIVQPLKSSTEILSELFSSFDAEPPIIIKTEKGEGKKRHKKTKKKHKKEKKHKSKDRKRKRTDSSNVDLAKLLIKQERQSPEKRLKLNEEKDSTKINVEDTEFSSILKATVGNIKEKSEKRNSTDKSKKEKSKKKHKCKHEEKTKKKKKLKGHCSKEKSKSESHKKTPELEYKSTDKCSDKRKVCKNENKYKEDSKEKEYHRENKDNQKTKHRESSRSSDYSHKYKDEEKWLVKDKRRSYFDLDKDRERKYKDRSRSRDRENHFDKKKLLEIARRNAIQMMKSGSLPAALTLGRQAQEKVLAAIRAGGKTIEELTDFCKTLSKKEELGELSSISGEEGDSDNENRAFHHPFQIKDRSIGIVMNIKRWFECA